MRGVCVGEEAHRLAVLQACSAGDHRREIGEVSIRHPPAVRLHGMAEVEGAGIDDIGTRLAWLSPLYTTPSLPSPSVAANAAKPFTPVPHASGDAAAERRAMDADQAVVCGQGRGSGRIGEATGTSRKGAADRLGWCAVARSAVAFRRVGTRCSSVFSSSKRGASDRMFKVLFVGSGLWGSADRRHEHARVPACDGKGHRT